MSNGRLKGLLVAGLLVAGVTVGLSKFTSAAKDNGKQTTAARTAKKDLKNMKKEDFYKDGKFQADKAKEVYFAMMKRMHYPIPQSLKDGMWVTDFNLGDFPRVGMAGIIWYNDKATHVFGHDIYLLPNQMLIEHGHEAVGDVPPKREAWHVRNGSICTFGEGEPSKEACPVTLPASQEKAITVKAWKLVKEGETDDLKRATAKHFMVAGPQGAIVTEYGTYHDGAGLRFTNPAAKF